MSVPARKIPSGVWLCLLLAVFGGGVVLAFFWAARQATHPAASSIPFGEPSRPLRLMSLELKRSADLSDADADRIRQFDPDYLYLQQTHGKALADLQRRLGGKLIAAAYYPLQNVADADNDVGNAILSKHPLEDGRPIPNHMSGACGVWASSVIDGRRFYVACLFLSGNGQSEAANFSRAWESLGKPPLLAAIVGDAGVPQAQDLRTLKSDPLWRCSNDWIGSDEVSSENAHQIEARPKPF